MAVDEMCCRHGVECVAQISGGKYKPKHMAYQKFYSIDKQSAYIEKSQFVITHGGFGVIGDVLCKGKPLLVFPRPPEEGPNDQRPVVKRLYERYGFCVSNNLEEFSSHFVAMLNDDSGRREYLLETNVPAIIGDFLNQI
ncbi:MAG: hypothetical protein COB22_02355 [Cycloclasticus sp.]|nr:MAG: hypothetical protein COB22_02355 [Cycloclasticus sp.]